MRRYCILLASGTGSRFGADIPKQFIRIKGKMIIEYTLEACASGGFDEIILVVSALYIDEMRAMIDKGRFSQPIRVVCGGASRIESCANGIAAIKDEDAIVIVHNGVQPFVGKRSFENCFAALKKYSAVTCGVKCTYTILTTTTNRVLSGTPDRAFSYSDLGPEGFHIGLLRKVVEIGARDVVSTGLCGVVFRNSLAEVYVAEGERENFKITFPEDVILMGKMINEKRRNGNE